MALNVFTSARVGFEANRVTSVTPTRYLYGTDFTHEQTITTIRPEELRNNYEGFFTASTGIETNTFTVADRMSFEDAVWYANHYVAPLGTANSNVTGGGTGGTAYRWIFTPSGTADNVKTSTIQLGYADTIATAPGVQLAGALGNTWNLHFEKANADGAVTSEAQFFMGGTATQITAFTGSPTDRTVNRVGLFSTLVYLDAATIGTTSDSNVVSVDWTLNLSPVPFYSLDNTAGANAVYRPNHRTWTATIRRRYSSAAEWTIYQSKAERKIRVKALGPAFSTATNGTALLQLDLYGAYTCRTWSEIDGIITEDITVEPYYDSTATTSFSMEVIASTLGTMF